jgi:hypothetical protein
MRTDALALLLALSFAAAGSPALGASKTYELEAFSAVEISSGINAKIEVGPAQSIRAESPRQRDLDDLVVEVRDGRLRAYSDWNLLDLFNFGDRRVEMSITVPALDDAETTSGAGIDVTGMSGETVALKSTSGARIDAAGVAGKTFRIEVTSGARIGVEGACGSADVEVTSGATLRADRLECADVQVDASSGANASVFASSSVKADASSGASIDVRGKPASVEIDESSGGDVDID